jgi:hypothetical protein
MEMDKQLWKPVYYLNNNLKNNLNPYDHSSIIVTLYNPIDCLLMGSSRFKSNMQNFTTQFVFK